VERPVGTLEAWGDLLHLSDIRLMEGQAGVVAEALDIAQPAAGEVVDDYDLVAILKQYFREVAADESATAGYYCFHVMTYFFE